MCVTFFQNYIQMNLIGIHIYSICLRIVIRSKLNDNESFPFYVELVFPLSPAVFTGLYE